MASTYSYNCRITTCPTNKGIIPTAGPSSSACSVYHDLLASYNAHELDDNISLSDADCTDTKFEGQSGEVSYATLREIYKSCTPTEQWDIEEKIRAQWMKVRKDSGQLWDLRGDQKLALAMDIRSALSA